jgi:Flp pilus assembly pilin Flp
MKNLLTNESGLETVEWSVLAALIVLGICLLVVGLSDAIGGVFTALINELQTAQQ